MNVNSVFESVKCISKRVLCVLFGVMIVVSSMPSGVDAVAKEASEDVFRVASLNDSFNFVNSKGIRRGYCYELLSEEGCVTERACDGAECLKMLENAEDGYYRMVIMDVQMPVMDGYEATRAIRKLDDKAKAEIPVIAMTANAFTEDKQVALAAGMNDHVAKPIDMSVLVPIMKKYL